MKVIHKDGMSSKRLPCWKCGRRRWSGWWVKILGWDTWVPACTGCATRYAQRHRNTKLETFIQKRER